MLCVSAQVQILCHLGYEPSVKDARDVLALCRKFELPIPDPYRAFSEAHHPTPMRPPPGKRA